MGGEGARGSQQSLGFLDFLRAGTFNPILVGCPLSECGMGLTSLVLPLPPTHWVSLGNAFLVSLGLSFIISEIKRLDLVIFGVTVPKWWLAVG